jgi:hypothetical protein
MTRSLLRLNITCLGLILACNAGAGAHAGEQVSHFNVKGTFMADEKATISSDISGAACMPAQADGSRVCVFVDDETRHAQFARIEGGVVTPGDIIPLIGKASSPRTVGTPPKPGEDVRHGGFAEFDGEAVAYDAPWFYVSGSHGLSRKKGKFRLSSFILARFRVTADGVPASEDGAALPKESWADAVETTYRLSDVLKAAEGIGERFATHLEDEDGLNVEGIAVHEGRLIAGLRAPGVEAAWLVMTDVEALFAPGAEPARGAPDLIRLDLGRERGIRDLAIMPDGRLLVLAGPAQEQALSYELFIVEPLAGAKPLSLGLIETPAGADGEPARAEAIILLGLDEREAHLLVLFDGLTNGGAQELRMALHD